jgi:sulfonate transport system ATP-binding protein
MRARPGRVFAEIEAALPRPRDRQSAAFDFVKRRGRSSTPASPTTAKTRASAGAALWW